MTGVPQEGITVVVPVYNRAALLPATLDAILAQTAPPREVIVVDDGSTDETPAVLARYAPRIRGMRIANSGDLTARNAGLAEARGGLVAFCDSDDLWRPGFLAAMTAMWSAEPRLRLAFSDFQILRDGMWQERTKFAEAPPGYWDGMRKLGPSMAVFDVPVFERLLQFQPFFPSCLVADRRFLLEIGGWDASVGRRAGCDFATTLRLAEHTPFGVVQEPLVGIRKHAGNHSGDVQAMNLGDAWVLQHVLSTRASLRPYAAAIQSSIHRRRVAALDIAFARHDYVAVRDIAALLPRESLSLLLRVKALVASLPKPFGLACGTALLMCGSVVSSVRR
jgi:glycosyltransferase involved in cell wall biosynthesis